MKEPCSSPQAETEFALKKLGSDPWSWDSSSFSPRERGPAGLSMQQNCNLAPLLLLSDLSCCWRHDAAVPELACAGIIRWFLLMLICSLLALHVRPTSWSSAAATISLLESTMLLLQLERSSRLSSMSPRRALDVVVSSCCNWSALDIASSKPPPPSNTWSGRWNRPAP